MLKNIIINISYNDNSNNSNYHSNDDKDNSSIQ